MIMSSLNCCEELEKILLKHADMFIKTGKGFLDKEEYDFLYKKLDKMLKEKTMEIEDE
jgi:hypothetical protein